MIDFLIAKGLSREEASSFCRVDFYYEYTSDGEKYALVHARFYEKRLGDDDRSRLIYSYSVDEASKKFHETHNDSVMREAASIMSDAKVFYKSKLSKILTIKK